MNTTLSSDRPQGAAATLPLVARVRAALLALVFMLAGIGTAGVVLSSCEDPPPAPITKSHTGQDSQGRSATGTATANTNGTVTITSTFNTAGETTVKQVVAFFDGDGNLLGSDAEYSGGSATVTPPSTATTVVVGAQSSGGATFFTKTSISQ
jgi:hypothetical protein